VSRGITQFVAGAGMGNVNRRRVFKRQNQWASLGSNGGSAEASLSDGFWQHIRITHKVVSPFNFGSRVGRFHNRKSGMLSHRSGQSDETTSTADIAQSGVSKQPVSP
jgi:hypothetical protein